MKRQIAVEVVHKLTAMVLVTVLMISMLSGCASRTVYALTDEPVLACTHEHDEACGYTAGDAGAPCAHEHIAACYVLGCGMAEHMHTQECMGLICTEEHEHGEECYGPVCGLTEHSHDMSCRAAECGMAEHIHTGECYALACAEEHEHTDACYELRCTLTEHSHDESCYKLDCHHEHDEACGYREAVTGSPCTHEHTAECYRSPSSAALTSIIKSFERHDPVETIIVSTGTQVLSLGLPESLRAVVEIDGSVSAENFTQHEPTVDMSDGYEYYDYYKYGYVAPKDVAELYAAGETAVYTIYYAGTDENGEATDQVAEAAYRVYGAIADGEQRWYSCDALGNITGAVVDIPVSWTGDYDGETPGKYILSAGITGYAYDGPAPFAAVTVEAEKVCTCGAKADEEGNITHAEDCPLHVHDDSCGEKAHCTCDVGEDTLSSAHDKTCPCHHADCTCALGKNEPSADHDKTCPWYAQQEPVCTCGAVADEEGNITHAEDCPLYVRRAVDCHCGPEGEAVDAENFPWTHQEDCVNFSPIECMCREQVEVTETVSEEDGSSYEETIMVSGGFSHVHDPNNKDCPLYGKDTVSIQKLDVDSRSAEMMGGDISAMSVEDARRIAAYQEAHDEALYPALGKIAVLEGSEEYGSDYDVELSLLSINGGGANDTAQDNYMVANSPTSGSPATTSEFGVGVPGSWVDYVNTIWMNKGYNNFSWTPHANTGAFNGWSWSGNTASQTTGTVKTNQYKIPVRSSTTWTVYSVEQLQYAWTNLASGDTISIGGNLDFNGSSYSFVQEQKTNKSVKISGNAFTLYNIGSYVPDTSTSGGKNFPFRISSATGTPIRVEIRDLNISNSKSVSSITTTFISVVVPDDSTEIIADFTVLNSMVFSSNSSAAPVGMYSGKTGLNSSSYMTRSISRSNYIRAVDHAQGFAGKPAGNVSYCAAVDNLICGTGGHSAGFSMCLGTPFSIKKCFASAEQYGSRFVAGFGQALAPETDSCYATGKLEGYGELGGFDCNLKDIGIVKKISNCYSTVLVGLRTEATTLGGFVASTLQPTATTYGTFECTDCYAAGEVGNTNTDMTAPDTIGGFSNINRTGYMTMSNCYYDKQTTAMREWAAGETKTVPGVKGVLTTDSVNSASQTETGLTSAPGVMGFTGFSDNTQWTFAAEHYPQLNVFANASSTEWGSAETANLVRAYSLASTATVFLDTWSRGYDWDENGVRTANTVSYDRTLASTGKTDHAANELTYDTVREIVSNAPVTSTASWTHMISGGAPVDTDGDGAADGNAMEVSAAGGIQTIAPGMDWYRISETVGGQTGFRPIRLIAYMDIDAGADKIVAPGAAYDHRTDVSLTMMDSITDNLVVGLNDAAIWSTAVKGGYPDSSRFWAVPTTGMETGFTASRDAWIYTEIWRAKQNADGSFVTDAVNGLGTENLVPELSVKVTGSGTGDGLTLTEQKWNGELPLYPDTSVQRKYVITYYWMLSDGRYRTDTKTITINPGEYTVAVNVLNNADDSANAQALHIGAAEDAATPTTTIPAYTLSTNTASNIQAAKVGYTDNASVGWKKADSLTNITKLEIKFTATDGTVMGTGTFTGNPAIGSTVVVPTTCYYTAIEYDAAQGANREVTYRETVDITYTVETDSAGGLRLRFNKLANTPSDEIASATLGGSNAGVPGSAKAYLNDIQYNTTVTLWIEDTFTLTLTKTVKGSLADPHQSFTFTLSLPGVTASLPYTGSVSGTVTNNGTVTLKHGQSITIENVPANLAYSILESGNTGYSAAGSIVTGTATAVAFTGSTAAGTLTDNATVSYVNSKEPVVPTGVVLDVLPYILLLALAGGMAGLMSAAAGKRRRRSKRRNGYKGL